MSYQKASWIVDDNSSALCIFVDTTIYPLEVVFRTCYVFTEKCYLFLDPTESPTIVKIQFKPKLASEELHAIAAQFSNELINQRVRLDVANETRAIRELIVAQAFAEADFVDKSECEASYVDDPRGISLTK